MRYIHINDDKNRDATVASFTLKSSPNPDLAFKGKRIKSIRILESSDDKTYLALKKKYKDNLVEAIINDDIDIDFIKTGLIISTTSKSYLSNDGAIMNQAPEIVEVIFDSQGEEKSRGKPNDVIPNVREDTPPIKWAGKYFNKKEAITSFVFQRTIQLQHTSGLTYDFLFQMAKSLHDKNQLMFVGAGNKGNEPLIFQLNGTPMRGFLEGRTNGTKYQLLLHLSNMEIKIP